jgi:DNA uptake protein ComE-like DNA-binding protein
MTHQLEPVEPPLYSRSVQIPVVAVLILALVGAVSWMPAPAVRQDSKVKEPLTIDLNLAPPRELSLLPGIGPVLAKRIFENRQRLGPFESAREVGRVYGVGDKTIEAIAPYATVNRDRTAGQTRLASGGAKQGSGTGAER